MGGTYEDLLHHTLPVTKFGRETSVLDLSWLIRVKRAAGRPRDLEALAELEAIQETHQGAGVPLPTFPEGEVRGGIPLTFAFLLQGPRAVGRSFSHGGAYQSPRQEASRGPGVGERATRHHSGGCGPRHFRKP